MNGDGGPTRPSSVVAVAAAVAAAGALRDPLATALGVVGVAAVLQGVRTGSERWVGYGAVTTLVAVAVAVVQGLRPGAAAFAAAATLLAADVGRYGIALGAQVGRTADTGRAEALHALTSVVVGTSGAVVAYATYLAVHGGGSVFALALLVAGSVLVVATLP